MTRGILQARETLIGGEPSAAALQDDQERSHQEQPERQRDHEFRQVETAGAPRAAHASARHRRLRQHLHRDTLNAGDIARMGPAQADEVTGRGGGAGGGREIHVGFDVRVREKRVRGGSEMSEVRGRELRGVATVRIIASRCDRGRTARCVVLAAERVRANAIGHVTNQAGSGHFLQRARMTAQAVEQHDGGA